MNSQKSHMTGFLKIFLRLLKLNLISLMAKCPNKGKTNILYYVFIAKKVILFIFFEQKNIEQKNICPKKSRKSEYGHF